ncbi:urease accessory protein UreF [uncultured Cohaesibacter sp.]|uniref:urease accessory protein UreF n=1 Tax=uncultured Cohaesibacter sp. TaxID=1002546 RepID=UPI0029C994A8|nr:urease accessory protein UreF [uncultured Cohaesibacter sp.]
MLTSANDAAPITNGVGGSALIRLITFLSPAFPIGAFSYSHGLEVAIAKGTVKDQTTALDWLQALLLHGGGWSDAVLLSQSWQADDIEAILSLNEFALAMAPSAERHLETVRQGAAFLKASKSWPIPLHTTLADAGVDNIAMPVIVGTVAKAQGIPLESILPASLHAFSSNLISVAMRLVPLGQSDGLALQAGLEATILKAASRARTASLDDIGTCCLASDIAAMQHEHLTTRIFRS